MKPYIHAKASVKRYGGLPEDYIEIHNFMDSTKSTIADVRHRAILHSAFGCFIVEKVFGTTMKNSDGKIFSVRDIAEEHIIEDLGFIPTVEKWFEGLKIEQWMGGPSKKVKKVFDWNDDKVIEEELKKREKFFSENDKTYVD